MGARGGAVGWGTALQAVRLRIRFPIMSLEFFIEINLPVALWPWSWLSLYQKWVPGISPGCKGGRCVWLTTLPPSNADYLEIWEPQPPGALKVVQACNGIALPCFTSTVSCCLQSIHRSFDSVEKNVFLYVLSFPYRSFVTTQNLWYFRKNV